MKYTTYEPQQNVYESRVKPSILSDTQWGIWIEFNRGLTMREISKIYGKTIHQVNKIFDECVYALKVSPAEFQQSFEPTCWQQAFTRKMAIIKRFNDAPVVDGCKRVMSEL